jgi:hypothetical protein
MTDAEWCHASWYVIYPVALLPHLERDSFEGPLPAAHIAGCELSSRT